MRGKAHSDEVKAQVMAALLAGQGVMEIAREHRLDEATVRNWKRTLTPAKLTELNAKKGDRLDDLLFDYLTATLAALRKQVETASDATYVKKQRAGDLAILHGVMADKAVRILEAADRISGDTLDATAGAAN